MKPNHLSGFSLGRRLLSIAALWLCSWVAVAQQVDFVLPDIDGQAQRLSDYRGPWVVVNYWATWCPPCREELPELEVFHAGNEGRAVVLGVNMERIEAGRLRTFVEEQFLSFPILVAGERPLASRLVGPVDGLPTTYLVAPSGKVVARQVGQVTASGLHGFIERYERQPAAQ